MVCVPFTTTRPHERPIKQQVDHGATLIYSHGGDTDSYMMNGGKIDVIAADGRSDQGPGRAGRRRRPLAEHAHGVREEQGQPRLLRQDASTWTATGRPRPSRGGRNTTGCDGRRDHDANNDNMWCNNPEETAAFMETVEKPWVAFKVMAAGAIHAAGGVLARLSQRRRFRHRRHVRFPGRVRREVRHRMSAKRAFPQAALAGVILECGD